MEEGRRRGRAKLGYDSRQGWVVVDLRHYRLSIDRIAQIELTIMDLLVGESSRIFLLPRISHETHATTLRYFAILFI